MDYRMGREISKARNFLTTELFEDLYKPYPRKQGKSPALRALRGQITTRKASEEFKQAVENYRAHLKRNATEAQYVMYFDTFSRQWRDWLDPDHGKVTLEKQELDLSHIDWDPE